MMGLTRRQAELLTFISYFIAKNGMAPSFDDMQRGVGLSSRGGVHRMLSELENRGRITRLFRHARAIEVVESPPDDRRLKALLSDILPGVLHEALKAYSRDNRISPETVVREAVTAYLQSV
jgi:SOS-response transcriptional repressor LexA